MKIHCVSYFKAQMLYKKQNHQLYQYLQIILIVKAIIHFSNHESDTIINTQTGISHPNEFMPVKLCNRPLLLALKRWARCTRAEVSSSISSTVVLF
jgi:hypothetical protein